MPVEAVALIIVSALMHATWNAVMKRSRDPHVQFLSMAGIGGLVTAPWLVGAFPAVPWEAHALACLSGLLEVGYVWLLATAYQRYDFSLVYPVARGSAPLILMLFAIVALGERPSPIAIGGIVAIVVGIYAMSAGATSGWLQPLRERSVGLSLAVGVTIASYSAIDKIGVGFAPAIAYVSLVYIWTGVWLLPTLLPGRGVAGIVQVYRDEWRAALLVGTFSGATYAIVVFAFSLSPVSYAGALREISVVFAALIGWLRFREPLGPGRTVAAVVVALGASLIAFG